MSFDKMSTEELGSFVSDLHKDMYGFRPRHLDFSNREELVRAANSLDNGYQLLIESVSGRQHLREFGWDIPPEDHFEEEDPFVYCSSYQPPVMGDLF